MSGAGKAKKHENISLNNMDPLSDMAVDQMYSNLLAEQTKLLSEMKNSPDKFKDNETLHRQVTAVMVSLLKFKTTRTKIRNRAE